MELRIDQFFVGRLRIAEFSCALHLQQHNYGASGLMDGKRKMKMKKKKKKKKGKTGLGMVLMTWVVGS